jgi:hypothetical protein
MKAIRSLLITIEPIELRLDYDRPITTGESLPWRVGTPTRRSATLTVLSNSNPIFLKPILIGAMNICAGVALTWRLLIFVRVGQILSELWRFYVAYQQ